MLRLDANGTAFGKALEKLRDFDAGVDDEVNTTVAAIIADVAKTGDDAVLRYTAKFDQLRRRS